MQCNKRQLSIYDLECGIGMDRRKWLNNSEMKKMRRFWGAGSLMNARDMWSAEGIKD